MKKAIIIGSGIAGIAAALRLRKKGFSVTVIEANPYTGGKLHALSAKGYRFDAGPSLFTMPHLVDELFALFGQNPKEYFEYNRKKVVCNYFWDDGKRFTVVDNEQQFIADVAAEFNENPRKVKKYLKNNKAKYNITHKVFLEQSLHKLKTYTQFATVKSFLQLYKLNLFGSLHALNKRTFSNPKMVQLFDRYATYNGSSPYKTPGIMSIIPHFEMGFGTFFPKKGMHHISQSLYNLALQQGVLFKLNEPVIRILLDEETGEATGVKTINGEYQADIIVSNMDVYGTYNKLLKGEEQPIRTLSQERSSSALIFYWGIKREFKELDLHNIFFSEDYIQEFDYLFNKKSMFADPTVYVHISSKDKADDAPNACENWFVMVNAPANIGQDWASLKTAARQNIIDKINRILSVNIEEYIETESVLDPIGIESKTSSYQGSLYGTSSNSQFSAFLRHPNFSSDIPNLYFCGGSVHPGGGIPLCLLSAKIVADNVPNPNEL